MILLAALALGLLAGWVRARWIRKPYQVPALRYLWLVPVAFLPQLLVAYLPGFEQYLPDRLSAAALPVSLLAFAAFVWLNRATAGMPVLLLGLILNLLVIVANGGWMPISPETASQLSGGEAVAFMSPGSRFGQKDVLLLPEETRFELLSDRFLLPDWIPYKVALSLGDMFVAIGTCWLMISPRSKSDSNRSE